MIRVSVCTYNSTWILGSELPVRGIDYYGDGDGIYGYDKVYGTA